MQHEINTQNHFSPSKLRSTNLSTGCFFLAPLPRRAIALRPRSHYVHRALYPPRSLAWKKRRDSPERLYLIGKGVGLWFNHAVIPVSLHSALWHLSPSKLPFSRKNQENINAGWTQNKMFNQYLQSHHASLTTHHHPVLSYDVLLGPHHPWPKDTDR